MLLAVTALVSVKLLHSRNTSVLQTNLISFQIYVVSVHILPFFVVIEFPGFTFVPLDINNIVSVFRLSYLNASQDREKRRFLLY